MSPHHHHHQFPSYLADKLLATLVYQLTRPVTYTYIQNLLRLKSLEEAKEIYQQWNDASVSLYQAERTYKISSCQLSCTVL